MADTPADTLKAIRDRVAAKKTAGTDRTKSGAAGLMGRLNTMFQTGQAPDGRTGRDTGAGVVPIQKALALAGGHLDASQDAEARDALDLSNRIKAVYGQFYEFSNNPNSLLVPASAGYLPAATNTGFEITGAKALRQEIAQRVLTVKALDPDEAAALARKGGEAGDLATKALSTLSDIAGGSTVAPPSLGDMIDLQRNLEVFSRAGSTSVTLPPNGRMSFPKLTGGSTAYWVGETASVTESQQTTGSLLLEVKKLAVRVPLTNELLRFSDQSMDGLIRMDMARIAALKADLAMLEGTGGTQIKGLTTYPSAASWTSGTDKLIAYSVTSSTIQPEDVTTMLAALPDGVDATAWVFRPDLFAKLRNRRADATVPGDGKGPFVFDITRSGTDGEPMAPRLADTKVVTSRQVSNARGTGAQTYALAGYFPDWLVGRLGVLEFMADPYTQLQNYQTVIQVVEFIDAGARHAASFVFADAITVQ